MTVGVPKEIKDNENRVGMTPAGVTSLAACGHRVVVERGAGEGSGFTDEEYRGAGAEILDSAASVYDQADIVVKVKEPLEPEYGLLRPGQTLFTYLHLAADKGLTLAMMRSKAIGIAYELVQPDDGSLPLLMPMSEVAGRMAVQVAAYYLARPHGGSGVLMTGVPGVPAAHVVVLGGGTVGLNAARVACGMGARVTVLESNGQRIRFLENVLPKNATVVVSNTYSIAAAVADADVLIGAVLIPGAKAPRLVTREMVRSMRPRSVIVDVAVDQGGCVETTRPTTHSNPTYVVDGVLHYCVANMPGAYARTSTIALTSATLPYVIEMADKGPENALRGDPALLRGLSTYFGTLTSPPVGAAHGLSSVRPEEVLVH